MEIIYGIFLVFTIIALEPQCLPPSTYYLSLHIGGQTSNR